MGLMVDCALIAFDAACQGSASTARAVSDTRLKEIWRRSPEVRAIVFQVHDRLIERGASVCLQPMLPSNREGSCARARASDWQAGGLLGETQRVSPVSLLSFGSAHSLRPWWELWFRRLPDSRKRACLCGCVCACLRACVCMCVRVREKTNRTPHMDLHVPMPRRDSLNARRHS